MIEELTFSFLLLFKWVILSQCGVVSDIVVNINVNIILLIVKTFVDSDSDSRRVYCDIFYD